MLAERPYRSVLYVPASNTRAMEKARSLPADAIIFDLEDAVAPDAKVSARRALVQTLEQSDRSTIRIVRINGLETAWGHDDAVALGQLADVVLLPKVSSAADLDEVARLVPDTQLWAMMETARGVANAQSIADHPRLLAMVMGNNDLAKELGCKLRADRLGLQTSLGLCVLAAKAAGCVILDGVVNAYKDVDALRGECLQGRDLGFDGKTLIHPAQIDAANEVFAPSAEDVELARRQITAFEAARENAQGIAVVDGQIVENLHVETARKILARATLIEKMET